MSLYFKNQYEMIEIQCLCRFQLPRCDLNEYSVNNISNEDCPFGQENKEIGHAFQSFIKKKKPVSG